MNRKRIAICWDAVRPLLIYLVLFITIRSVLYYISEAVLFEASAETALYDLFESGITEVVIIGLSSAGAVLPILKTGRRNIMIMRSVSWQAWIIKRRDRRLLMGLLPVGTLCLSALLNLLLAGDSASGQVTLPGYALPVGAAVYGILTPFVEELVYRGIVWYRLRKGFSPLEAAFLSSLLFGIAHANLYQGIYAFVMGMIFSLSYELTRRFEVPFLLHCSCNLAVLAASSANWGEVLQSPMWIVFFAVAASLVFLYWYRRIIETNFNL